MKKISILILLFVTIFYYYYNTNIKEIKDSIYKDKAIVLQSQLQYLMDKKQGDSAALTYLLSQDKNLQKSLVSNNNSKLDYSKIIQGLNKNTRFKNIWIQVTDKNGKSFYRSWTKKVGDDLSKARMDIADMIKNPKAMNQISTGRFDMTFKSIRPLYDDGKFIGMIEMITHFNSIDKNLKEIDIEDIMLVDKSYKKRFIKPLTGLFIDDYYVANKNASKKLMSSIQTHGVDKFVRLNNYILFEDYLVTKYETKNIKNKDMGFHILFYKINKIDMTKIEEFKVNILIVFIIISIFIALVIIVLIGYSSIRHDITAQKDFDKQHQQLIESEKMASIGEMIGNIAHQWRQPLSVISTSATALILKQECDMMNENDLVDSCNNINNNAQYLSKTIDDFRNFIKGDQEIQEFNLEEITQSFLKLIDSTTKNNNLKVITTLDKGINLKGYPNELIQCFINIFNNSKDALVQNNKDKNRYIFISQERQDKHMKIIFKDNAGGIHEDILPKIFEPYFTTKHQSQGTGLGLHMTYNLIVDSMDGSITANNTEFVYENHTLKGAQFTIKVPII